jgi:phosphate transport system substrate-binding protein
VRLSFSKTLAFLAFHAGLLLAVSGASAETLRLAGTGTATEMLRQVGAQFTADTGIEIVVIPSLGSSGAIRALADGLIDIAVPARSLNAEETTGGLRQVMVLRTAYVIATSHPHPNGLKSSDIAKIFAAEGPTWSDGTPIRKILRPRSDADTTVLALLFAGMGEAIEAARRHEEVPTAATDQDNIDLAERTPGSLTGTTMTQLKTEHRKLRVVPLDGVEPTFANFESGTYPFAKRMFVLVPRNDSTAVQKFVEFLRSPRGVAALRETEALPSAE